MLAPNTIVAHLKSLLAPVNIPLVLGFYIVGLIVESYRRAEPQHDLERVVFNTKYTIVYLVFGAIIHPLLGYSALALIQSCGGGWFEPRFHFESDSLNQFALGATYLVIFDFFYYWLHRFQHRLPILWSEHKLHHSDTALNVTTTFRHHLLEDPLRMLFVLVPMGILFKITPVTGGLIGLMFVSLAFFIHLNLRLYLGFLTPVITGPQLHRIHHSNQRKHFDKNFASMFPIYDILFGTFYWPGREEFPTTGLDDGQDATTVAHAVSWPVRDWLSGGWRRGWKMSPLQHRLNVGALTIILIGIAGAGCCFLAHSMETVQIAQPGEGLSSSSQNTPAFVSRSMPSSDSANPELFGSSHINVMDSTRGSGL